MHSPIAITMGDAAGIGPEIIARHFIETRPTGAFVIGDPGQMQRAARLLGSELAIAEIDSTLTLPAQPCIPVLSVGSLDPDLPYGRIDARNGRLAYDAILKAIALAKSGAIDALVTAPIHKEALHAAGVPFPGHTEILAAETGTRDFGMMLIEGKLRVILVSIQCLAARCAGSGDT